ncbi:hypothetical protein RIF29_11213 [Crotalaria pallida]|uniref:Uncharacterized protein n=1 Tax=Crotalaria pallida TaxID=3830 RepID=A0AAN9ILY5_CROPI
MCCYHLGCRILFHRVPFWDPFENCSSITDISYFIFQFVCFGLSHLHCFGQLFPFVCEGMMIFKCYV